MNSRWSNFLSSFGMMLIGVVLLFVGSIKFTARPVQSFVARLPVSHPRNAVVGGDVQYVVLPVSKPTVPLAKDTSTFPGRLSAEAALVVDDESNTVLFKKNAEAIRPLASLSKLMSSLVLSDMPLNWSSSTVLTSDDIEGGDHHVNAGEAYTLDDLWHIGLIGSSNNSIEALVKAAGTDDGGFSILMNRKSEELGLLSMHFLEPTGLNSGNVGSAIDIARLLKEALKVDKIYHTLQIGEYYATPLNGGKKRRVWTTNWLLTNWVPSSFSKDDIVGKTGFIDESGYNFAVRLVDQKHNHALRIVVLGADTNEARFSEARDLANWTFNHYVWPDQEGYEKLVE